MTRIDYRPLSVYPVPETRHRKKSPFRVSVPTARSDLHRELRHLGAQRGLVEMDITEADIRNDGEIRSNARPASPRIVLSVPESKYGPLRYPCDTFLRWEDNLRAIGLSLEKLRAVDRYGVTRRGEQYSGWKALPASTEPTMTAEAAASLVASWFGAGVAQDFLSSADDCKVALRRGLIQHHPDRGGTPEDFHLVQAARKVLSTYHGVSL